MKKQNEWKKRDKLKLIMLSLLFAFSHSYDEQCVAPHNFPDRIDGKTLKFVEVLTRHGARAPLGSYDVPVAFRGYWQCDSDDAIAPRMHAAPIEHYRRFKQVIDQRLTEYLPNCRSGDLTLSGMMQHKKLGEAYHTYLYETTKLFKEETELIPDPSTIFARCSDVERTFRSAQSFLHGVFPPQSPNEIIDIVADTDAGALLRPNKDWCQDMTDLWNNHTQTDEYKSWVKTSYEKVQPVIEFLNLEGMTGENVNTACDYVSTHYCDDKQPPSVVTPEIEQICLNITGDWLYDYYLKNPSITGSYGMRELLRIPKLIKAGKSSIKFALMSSHDTTVAAINALLGGKAARHPRIPPFASHLLIELWEDDTTKELYIRCALNGELIPLYKHNNETVIKFDDFLNDYSEIDNYCHEFR